MFLYWKHLLGFGFPVTDPMLQKPVWHNLRSNCPHGVCHRTGHAKVTGHPTCVNPLHYSPIDVTPLLDCLLDLVTRLYPDLRHAAGVAAQLQWRPHSQRASRTEPPFGSQPPPTSAELHDLFDSLCMAVSDRERNLPDVPMAALLLAPSPQAMVPSPSAGSFSSPLSMLSTWSDGGNASPFSTPLLSPEAEALVPLGASSTSAGSEMEGLTLDGLQGTFLEDYFDSLMQDLADGTIKALNEQTPQVYNPAFADMYDSLPSPMPVPDHTQWTGFCRTCDRYTAVVPSIQHTCK